MFPREQARTFSHKRDMGERNRDRELIERILSEYAALPVTYGEIDRELVLDRSRDRYLLMLVGWQNKQRVHGALIHIDLIDGRFWIQYDGTERGVALDLLEAGISKDRVVLGYKPPERRQINDIVALT